MILGIESSCDETAAAVVKDGTHILSSIVSSQIAVHHKYGGVVPELASRMHIESIISVADEAISSAGINIEDIEGVAATRGPGLIGALLVGFSFAKAFAWARKIPLAGVNHLEGHIYSALLSDNPPQFPFVVLLASGGHTNLYYVTGYHKFEIMGQTRDDAAGEAFDKVAKMLGLGYPGGAVIEKLAEKGDPSSISFPKSYLEKESFDFSFSGIKSAVARYIHESAVSRKFIDINSDSLPSNTDDSLPSNRYPNIADIKNINFEIDEQTSADIAAAFQDSVVEVLANKLINAAISKGVVNIAVAGGVAANCALKNKILSYINFNAKGLKLHIPPPSLCGDNAAMIAARGYRQIKDGNLCSLEHDVFSKTRI